MVDKNQKEYPNGIIKDETQVVSVQGTLIKQSIDVRDLPNRVRRQKGSCLFLNLLPKLGATALLADYEDDLYQKHSNLLEKREEGPEENMESKASEISMLKQSLDWLRLRGV